MNHKIQHFGDGLYKALNLQSKTDNIPRSQFKIASEWVYPGIRAGSQSQQQLPLDKFHIRFIFNVTDLL